MGANDAKEMLEVAKAECLRLERENTALRAQVVPQPDRDAAIKAILAALAGYDLKATQKDQIITDLLKAGFALSPAPLTINREALAFTVFKALEHGKTVEDWDGCKAWPGHAHNWAIADAVIAHLSAQTVEGEVEWEYNIAYPETTAEGVVWWNPDGAEPSDSIDIVRDWLASGSYLDSDRIVRRRKAGPWIEVQS